MKLLFKMAVYSLGMLWGMGLAHAQTMPQDNWRYDNLTFTGPNADVAKRCIAIGSGGVYVGQDAPATNIVQFQENGLFVRKFGGFGRILGMACDSAGNLYVLDRTDSKIKVFSKDGIALREWGGPGSADGQFGLASWDGTSFVAVDTNDQVYVCDPGNSRVQVFNDQGNFLRKWGRLGTLPGQFASGQPLAIAAGKNGWVYVGSTSGNPPNLQIFDMQGNFIKSCSISDVSAFAVTADGLLAANWYPWWGYISFYDLSLAQVCNIQGINTDRGIAFNAGGDLYRVTGNNIEVYEREYSSVQNSLLPPAIPQPMVLAAAQRAGTSWLDVDYTVTDADSPTVQVGALAFINGGNTLNEAVPMSTFMEGTAANIGASQPVNTTRRITWNMAADWSVDFAQIKVEVLAKDGRNLLGVHWIRVPADGVNPAIDISSRPISDAELLSLWYWFVATHTGVSLANGTVRGTTGLYAGQTLASGTATTWAGRHFAYQQMGVRSIAPSEITRAQAGSYGFASVDSQSIVREALTPTSLIFGWGDNSGNIQTVPMYACNAVKVASGTSHMLALMTNGTVVAWGDNWANRATVPTGLTGVTAIAASDGGSFALRNDGTLVAWGGGGETSIPANLTNVEAFAVGEEHGLAALKDGTVACWGSDSSGAISGLPAGLSNVVAVTAGYYFSVALKSDGTVVAWGYNGHGEINVPAGLTNVVEISAGRHHVVARKTDGTVVAWGRTNEGQLNIPSGLTNAVQISAGGHNCSHTLARRSDGSVVAWGYNAQGQCNVPAGLAPASYVAAGYLQSFVIVTAQ